MKIINFKDTEKVKQAVQIAAAKDGKNVSKFLSDMVRANPAVAKELKNISRKSLAVS